MFAALSNTLLITSEYLRLGAAGIFQQSFASAPVTGPLVFLVGVVLA